MTICSACAYWLRGTWRSYGFTPPEFSPAAEDPSAGLCRDAENPLSGHTTPAGFGCLRFTEKQSDEDQLIRETYDREPWEVWHMIRCPDCRPPGVTGEAACHRCAGTGQVPQYADGYVGEQQTWEHPIAKERRVQREREARAAKLREELEAL